MSQFALTDEQKEFAKKVLDLARKVLAPMSYDIDKKGLYPWDIIRKFSKFGLMGIAVPKEYGGMGRNLFDVCLAVEQVAGVDVSAAMWVGVNIGGLLPLLNGGNAEQKSQYLPKIAAGEYITGVAFTEPEAGSDLHSLRTSAVRRSDHYVINGRKCFISNAGIAKVYSLLARTGKGKEGITGFILDADTPGLSVGKMERKMGVRGSHTGDLILEDCRIPFEKRLGNDGEGAGLAMGMLTFTRPLIGAQAVGLARGVFEYTLKYARENKARLSPYFENVKYRLADMAIRIEGARQLVYQTAFLADSGHSNAGKFSSMAKCFATDVAMDVCIEAVSVFGPRGYTSDFSVERFMRDAKILQIYEGTNQIQRVTIAKALLGR
ncbi:putative acyl-CoA dehydrogenase fadE25 [uncultured Desulfobacterium sp.]|uniref:Cyclohex-1-ene-1-carbonyl-CoA dehydrogenase n=1 Tax=uncultured Desulfobacterium sp. TaxID=201089 RepID=A0A445N0B7_9BACT|nr:putative acyl-CoA dehydrogenase fadE25 [uncultured Desulfobacterium sp.]